MGIDLQRESRKDEKLKNLRISAAEAIIAKAVEDGMKIRAVYADKRIELEFTQGNGKKITVYVRYEDFSTGGCQLISLVQRLDGLS